MDPDLRVVPAAALIPAPAPQPRFNLPIQTLGPSPNSQPDPPEATTTSRAGWGGLEQSLVKRQDDLGWDDPLTCNVGVCLPENSYCTVFETRASAVGICCQNGNICAPQTTCVPYEEGLGVLPASVASDINTQSALVISGTAFCGELSPFCVSLEVLYGYKSADLHIVNCWSGSALTTTSRNSLYRSYTSRQTGVVRTEETALISTLISVSKEATTSASTSESSTPTPELRIVPVKSKKLSGSEIAGVVIGSLALVCITACVIAFFFFRRRKHQRGSLPPPPPSHHNSVAYYPMYPQSPQTAPISPPMGSMAASSPPMQQIQGSYFPPIVPAGAGGYSAHRSISPPPPSNGYSDVTPGTYASSYPPSTQPPLNNPNLSAYETTTQLLSPTSGPLADVPAPVLGDGPTPSSVSSSHSPNLQPVPPTPPPKILPEAEAEMVTEPIDTGTPVRETYSQRLENSSGEGPREERSDGGAGDGDGGNAAASQEVGKRQQQYKAYVPPPGRFSGGSSGM